MDWFGESFSALKGQIKNFTQEVLAEGTEDLASGSPGTNASWGLEELQAICTSQEEKIRQLNEEIEQLKSQPSTAFEDQKNVGGLHLDSNVEVPESSGLEKTLLLRARDRINRIIQQGKKNSGSSPNLRNVTSKYENVKDCEPKLSEDVYISTLKNLDLKLPSLLGTDILGKVIQEYEAQLAIAVERNETLSNNLEELDQNHQHAVDQLLASKKSLLDQNDVLNVKIKSLNSKIEELTNAYHIQEKELCNKLDQVNVRKELELEIWEKIKNSIGFSPPIDALGNEESPIEMILKLFSAVNQKATLLREQISEITDGKESQEKAYTNIINELENGLVTLQSENQKLQIELNQSKEFIKDLEIKLSSKVIENQNLQYNLEELKKLNCDLKQELILLQSKPETKSEGTLILEDDLRRFAETHNKINAVENEKLRVLNEEKKALEIQKEYADWEISELKQQNSFLRTRMIELKQGTQNYLQELTALQTFQRNLELASGKTKESLEYIEGLRQENKKFIHDIEALQKCKLILQSQSTHYKNQISELKNVVNELENKLKISENKFDLLKTDMVVLERNKESLEAKHNDNDLDVLHQDLIKCESKLTELQKNEEKYLQEITELKRKCTKLMTSTSKTSNLLQEKDNEISLLKRDLAYHEELLTNLKKNLTSCETLIGVAQEKEQRLLLEVKQLGDINIENNAQLSKMSENEANLNIELHKYKDRTIKLEMTLNSLQEKERELLMELNKLRESMFSHSTLEKNNLKTIQSKEEELNKIKANLQVVEKDLFSMMQKNSELESQYVKLLSNEQLLKGKYDEILKDKQLLYSQNIELTEQVSCNKNAIEALIKEKTYLEGCLKEMECNLQKSIQGSSNYQNLNQELIVNKQCDNEHNVAPSLQLIISEINLVRSTINSLIIDIENLYNDDKKFNQYTVEMNKKNTIINSSLKKLNEFLPELLNSCHSIDVKNKEILTNNVNQPYISDASTSNLPQNLSHDSDQISFNVQIVQARLQEECAHLKNAFRAESNNNKVLQLKVEELTESERNLQKKLERLKEHLMSIEDSHTQETLANHEKIKELQEKLNFAEDKLKSSSTAFTSINIRANQQVESLQEQIRSMIQQRDDTQEKLSLAEDRLLQHEASLRNLQIVLEQFQRDKDREIFAATEKVRQELQLSLRKQQELLDEIEGLKKKLADAKEGLDAASRLGEQLELKNQLVGSLKDKVTELSNRLLQAEERVESLRSNTDSKVDRCLVRNLFVGYLTAPRNSQQQALHILSNVLNLTPNEMKKIGLETTSEFQDQKSPSLPEAFIQFLEKESRPKPQMFLLSKPPEKDTIATSSQANPDRSVRSSPLLLSDNQTPNLVQFPPSQNSSSILKIVLKENQHPN